MIRKLARKYFSKIPPLLLAGILLILLPIFTLMTLDRLERQKEFFTQRLIEKGVFLIRTFEAGTRTGMFTMQWGAQRIQTMLYETSLQPDVAYLMITSRNGEILAHSDASRVGRMFDAMPEVPMSDEDKLTVYHRTRQIEEGEQIFEVYKRFVPVRSVRSKGGWRGMRRHMHEPKPFEPRPDVGGAENPHPKKDWSHFYTREDGRDHPGQMEHYIFAGLSMEKEKFARAMFLRKTITQGIFFFLLGGAGILALLAFQAYKSTKASLKKVQAFSDTVIHHMPSGLITFDMSQNITSMNQTAKQIFGTAQDPKLEPWTGLMDDLMNQIDQTGNVRQAPSMLSREMKFTLDNGQSVLLDVTGSPIIDETGQISGFLFLFKDLTQIKELKIQVETNKRLAAIGKLAAGVAHEIRNPLSSIKGFATYFGNRYPDNETDAKTVKIMVSEVERINQSVTQLLEFAKPMAIEKKAVDIEQMIHHSLTLVQYDLDRKKIQVSVAIDTRQKIIETDGNRMNQVLLNLYINAIQAMDSKGKLDVRVTDAEQAQWIEIQIKDNGCGIDAADQELIFDPYFTTRPAGTGLGLSIVYRIIENLSGKIRVESDGHSGSRFIISLPIA